jgi:Protein of unknown function (DUF3568)
MTADASRGSGTIAVLLLGLLSLATATACSASAIGAGGAASAVYAHGDLEGRASASPPRIVEAAVHALKDMDCEIVSADSSGVDGHVVSRTSRGRRIDVTVLREDRSESRISIRVDSIGDEELSRQVLERIESRL